MHAKMWTASALAGIAAGAAVTGAAQAQSLESRAPAWHCDVTTTYSCQAQGCEPDSFDPDIKNPNERDVDVNFKTKSYVRQGWAPQKFAPRVEGDLTVFLLPDDTVYAIVKNDGGGFMEVRSNGLWSMSSFGNCTPAK